MEVTDEEQAAMAIKLADNVRELIRDEVKKALGDYGFVATLDRYLLAQVLASDMFTQPPFRDAVKRVMTEQMQKY